MGKTIQVSQLTEEIKSALTDYSDEVTDVAKEVVDKITDGVMDETKRHITWKDKKYSKSFALKTTYEDKRNKRKTWYVKDPHYRLTHLLEFGHKTRRKRNGKEETAKYPHVQYGYEFAKNNFEKEMKREIERCKI